MAHRQEPLELVLPYQMEGAQEIAERLPHNVWMTAMDPKKFYRTRLRLHAKTGTPGIAHVSIRVVFQFR